VVDPLRALVVGKGGREHALSLALSRDSAVIELHAAPGNPGTAELGTNHDIDPLDGTAVASLATRLGVNLVVLDLKRRWWRVLPMPFAQRVSSASARLPRPRGWKVARPLRR
jgi:phosphoribosylglycinamide synthetase-like protein